MFVRENLLRFLLAVMALSAAVESFAGVEVVVQSPSGEPIAGAVVTVTSANAKPLAAQPETAVMDQRDRQFVPYVLGVRTGTKVAFPNSDDIRHHVYSFSPAKRFELRLYAGEANAPVLFDTPGVVILGCNIHDGMVGYIYVTDAPLVNTTNADGRTELEFSGDGPFQVSVWHPRLTNDSVPVSRDVARLPVQPLAFSLQIGPPEPFRASANALEKKFQQLRRQRLGLTGRRQNAR